MTENAQNVAAPNAPIVVTSITMLRERVAPLQKAGIVLTLTGVVLISL